MLYPPSTSGASAYGTDAMLTLGVNLSHMLRMTQALVAGGRNVDLMGLERQVGLLCAKTLDLPPEEGRTVRPVLVSLLAELDTLSSTLSQQTTRLPDG